MMHLQAAIEAQKDIRKEHRYKQGQNNEQVVEEATNVIYSVRAIKACTGVKAIIIIGFFKRYSFP